MRVLTMAILCYFYLSNDAGRTKGWETQISDQHLRRDCLVKQTQEGATRVLTISLNIKSSQFQSILRHPVNHPVKVYDTCDDQPKMTPWVILCALAMSGVVGRFVADSYSALVSFSYISQTGSGVVSMVPDPVTGDLQPIVALNVTLSLGSHVMVGGLRSFVGGVAWLARGNYPGDRRLDLFDFSRGGWPSLPSTAVTKQGSMTAYTANCVADTDCSYVFTAQPIVYAGSTVTLYVNSQNVPISINISAPGSIMQYSWSFDMFDTNSSAFQHDSSIYTLPADFYPAIAPPPPPNATKISFYRAFTNDTWARNLANDNAASAAGLANWVCPSPQRGLIIAQFDVTVDANFGRYSTCKTNSCKCGMLSKCQRVGMQINGLVTNMWYSFPQSAMCAKGFAIGTNNCTWQADYKLVSAVTSDCFLSVKGDPNFPNGFMPSCANLDMFGAHIVFALQNCADVKDSLDWPADW
jgi:hypothetical protein